MPRSPSVPHTLARLLLVGLALALAGGALGLLYERSWLGADAAAARAVVAADVQAQFAAITARLRAATAAATEDPEAIPRAASGGPAAVAALFALAERASPAGSGVALTLYGADGAPLAWSGRPSVLPVTRVTGPAALFMVPSPIGPWLVNVDPVVDGAGRRVGSVAAEIALPLGQLRVGSDAEAYELPTAVVPVQLRPYTGSLPAGTPGAIVVTAPESGAPLAVIDVPDEALDAARGRWRARLWGAAAAGAALILL
ncbi:MAG: hypothetical protein Q8L86_01110, partial [Vicinamibacterales bacterium]|nr:hypothetical protein [Vicinamibacterales bacterium]